MRKLKENDLRRSRSFGQRRRDPGDSHGVRAPDVRSATPCSGTRGTTYLVHIKQLGQDSACQGAAETMREWTDPSNPLFGCGRARNGSRVRFRRPALRGNGSPMLKRVAVAKTPPFCAGSGFTGPRPLIPRSLPPTTRFPLPDSPPPGSLAPWPLSLSPPSPWSPFPRSPWPPLTGSLSLVPPLPWSPLSTSICSVVTCLHRCLTGRDVTTVLLCQHKRGQMAIAQRCLDRAGADRAAGATSALRGGEPGPKPPVHVTKG